MTYMFGQNRKFVWCVAVLISVLGVAGCGPLGNMIKAPPLPPEKLKAETVKIAAALDLKPDWLFPADSCPGDVMPARGIKSEYMADGCADDPNRCLAKCRADDANACYALALLVEQQNAPGSIAAAALFLRSCKLGIVSGCTNRAAMIAELESDDHQRRKCAAETFDKTCDRDDPWGCTMLGSVLSDGSGTEKNVPQALRVLQKACDISVGKTGPACKNAEELREAILRLKKAEGEVQN